MTVNIIGLSRDVYKGLPTTLCAGCGHNSITNHLIKALYEYGVAPHLLAKMSGIGCSSKTPAYFVEQAHGFNGVHGRMPSAATGAKLANREMLVLGVSGDGDTASIGLGQYAHMVRRNVDCVYIIENNGVYGLTKGQFSATADVGSTLKNGTPNEYATIDVCGLAIELGATFVARSFSGDGKQLVPLLRHLQRSRRFNQELCLREGSRVHAQRTRFHPSSRRDHGRLRTRHCTRHRARRRVACAATKGRS
jgi:2-oxoglutarate ferredoxin oxidoreductase subunit beta